MNKKHIAMESQWKAQEFSGKNIMDLSVFGDIQNDVGGITLTQANFNANYGIAKDIYYSFKENTQYTFSVDMTVNESESNGVIFYFYYTDGTYSRNFNYSLVTTTTPIKYRATLTSSADKTISHFHIVYTTGGRVYDAIWANMQIEQGSTATSYEPYCGGTPNNLSFDRCKGGYCSDKDEYGLKVVGKTTQESKSGKNLLNYKEFIPTNSVNTVEFINNGVKISGNYGIRIIFTNPLPVGTYACSYIRKITSGTPDVNMWRFRYEDSTYSSVTDYGISITATQAITEFLIYFSFGNASCVIEYTDIQLEKGSTATSYEPYCGGVPSPNKDYPEEIQCVKAGTKVRLCGKNMLKTEPYTHKHTNCSIPATWKYENGMYRLQVDAPYAADNDCKATILSEQRQTDSNYLDWSFTSITSQNYLPAGTYIIGVKFAKGSIQGGGSTRYSDSIGFFYNTLTGWFGGESARKWTKICGFTPDSNNGDVYTTTLTLTEEKPILIGAEFYLPSEGNPNLVVDASFEIMVVRKEDYDGNFEPYIGNEATTPCDLYKGDIWYPMSGKVLKDYYVHVADGTEEISNYTLENKQQWLMWFPVKGKTRWSAIHCTHKRHNGLNSLASDFCNDNLNGIAWFKSTLGFEETAEVNDFRNWLKEQAANGTPVKFGYTRGTPVIEQYDPQPVFMPKGIVNILQTPTELDADLSVTALVRR